MGKSIEELIEFQRVTKDSDICIRCSEPMRNHYGTRQSCIPIEKVVAYAKINGSAVALYEEMLDEVAELSSALSRALEDRGIEPPGGYILDFIAAYILDNYND